MIRFNVGVILFLLCVITAGCDKKEDALVATEAPEAVYGDHTLPQGDHDYDDNIVDFYKKYNTLILYKFEDKDIFWDVSRAINQCKYDPVTNKTTSGYMYTRADEAYISQQLDLLHEKFFKYFSDDFLKQYLPRKIFLMDKYLLVSAGTGTPDKQTSTKYAATAGIDYLGVTGGGKEILTMTAAEKYTFKGAIVNFFLQRLISKGVMVPPAAFTDLTNYSLSMPTWELTYGNGIIDWDRRQPLTDWAAYVELLVKNTDAKLNATGGFLNPAIDNKGTIRKKCNVVINHFKTQFNIDLQAIGNEL
ncbi:hypothetical protein GFS24_24925 [Chitinophaga sp. SYP-B3965]|uniref:hypothetical protein n=1 Tax=Chitinophaga sp. SYP-B3965 TaxID=2663120 RepID=UPI001299F3BD|nr:hypothetical protein [Chitinophaga sp. SYP-B3965]MRG48383.1 hypothetical protein [Chitinophaga sp. SYP-B3965]